MKKLILVAVCALAIGAFHPSAACADEPAKAEQKSTIQWVEGWSAGREAAKKSGKLMFVYVHRTHPS